MQRTFTNAIKKPKPPEPPKEREPRSAAPPPLPSIPFAHFALACKAWLALDGRAENGYLSARRVSQGEVVLNITDSKNNITRYVVVIPETVPAAMRPYDLEE